jgi:two-component system CheB/CheR fusion protein
METGRGWVIGIGSSAGGLEALSLFMAHLPENFQGSIIIAQHLAPLAKSMMVELVGKHSAVQVSPAKHNAPIEPAHAYIVPPNFDIEIRDGHMVLTPAGPETRPKPSVDEFFSSLAANYKERAVGIVLSGTGSDGAEGVRAIHKVGGLTFAQDGQSAKYDGMPRSAIDTSCIDAILPPDELASSLLTHLSEHVGRGRREKFDDVTMSEVVRLLKAGEGVDFSLYKMNTLRRRLAKRMGQVGVSSIDKYVSMLKDNRGECAQLSQDFLVSVTSFFRDPDVFETLRASLLDQVLKKEPGHEYRVWVAGCATGEEAYSIAMVLIDILERQRLHLFVKVFATDLDQDAILEARAGIYTEKELESVPANYLLNFFEKRSDNKFEVNKRLRDTVVFARQDMIQNPPFVKLDLISCRNVLIYFETALQKKVLETFHYALNPSGKLLLGKSESTGDTSKLFDTLDRKAKLYEKVNDMPPTNPFVRVKSAARAEGHGGDARRPNDFGPSLSERAMSALLEAHGLSGVLIDKECNAVQILGDVSKYVGFRHANVDFRLIHLLPKDVGVELPILIRKCVQDGLPHKSRRHRLGKGKSAETFQIVVRPLPDTGTTTAGRPLYLVSFEAKRARESLAANSSTSVVESELPSRVIELEQELHLTREHLQTVIEELGVANEELQSVNEELQSTNEELQSTNEEMETANEELQSSNEELTTLNEELAVKSSQLRNANVSLENIQNSIGSPLVVLDQKLNVVRYNPDALKVFALGPADIGNSILRVSAHCELANFKEAVQKCIASGEPTEVVCDNQQIAYQVRVMPFYDERREIVGAVLVFFDNTVAVRIQEKLENSERQIHAIIDGADGLICLKDQFGRYQMANRAYLEFFGMDGNSIVGKTDRELVDAQTAGNFRDADLEVVLRGQPLRREERLTNQKDGKSGVFLIHRFPLFRKAEDRAYGIGMVAVDITAQIDIQEKLKTNEARYRAIVEDQAVFVCRHQLDGAMNFANSVFTTQFRVDMNASFFDTIAEEDRAKARQDVASISAEQPTLQHEHRMAKKDGNVRWVRWIHRGIFGADGTAVEFQAVGFDVTEFRDQTDRLMDQEAVFSGVFANTSDFITVFHVENGEFILETLNSTAERAMGKTFQQVVGRPLREFVDVDKVDEVLSRYQRVLSTGKPELFDDDFAAPGSLKYFSTTVIPIPDSLGRIDRVAALSRDVSSYKNIERDLRWAKDSAEIANRAKSDFLASMSHELRTPLNVVLGMSKLLQESELDAEQKSFAGSIERSGRMLLSLIEDVLDISKIESGKVKLQNSVFYFPDLIDEVLELFTVQAAEKGLTLVHHIDPGARHHVVGDGKLPLRTVCKCRFPSSTPASGSNKSNITRSFRSSRRSNPVMPVVMAVRDWDSRFRNTSFR